MASGGRTKRRASWARRCSTPSHWVASWPCRAWRCLPPLLSALHNPPDVQALGARYLGTYLMGMPLIFGFFAVDAAFRASGDTRTPMLILGSSVVMTLILDPVLILGRFGVPGAGHRRGSGGDDRHARRRVPARERTPGASPDGAVRTRALGVDRGDHARGTADGGHRRGVQRDLRRGHAHGDAIRHARAGGHGPGIPGGELDVHGRRGIRRGGGRDRRAEPRRAAAGAGGTGGMDHASGMGHWSHSSRW